MNLTDQQKAIKAQDIKIDYIITLTQETLDFLIKSNLRGDQKREARKQVKNLREKLYKEIEEVFES